MKWILLVLCVVMFSCGDDPTTEERMDLECCECLYMEGCLEKTPDECNESLQTFGSVWIEDRCVEGICVEECHHLDASY